MNYHDFIASKATSSSSCGFEPQNDWDLFTHQQVTLQFACQKGRSAAFLDTGLGKSRVEAAAAAEFMQASGKPSLILTQTKVLNARFKADKDEKHICPMPLDLIERCLTLYSNPNDVVLDPFNGIGSTGYQAVKMGRRYVGIELKPEYAKQAAKFMARAEAEGSSSLLEVTA